MNVSEAITTRRSMRAFADKPVSRMEIGEIVRTAIYAPSAGNAQPWQIVVVDEPLLIESASKINPYADWAAKAPAGILVCGDQQKEKYDGFWVQDCAALTQNILLLAHTRGLGTTWTGVYPVKNRVDGFRRLFELPDHIIPMSFVLIGYPSRRSTYTERQLEDQVHYNVWKKENRLERSLAYRESKKTLPVLY